MPQFLGSTTPLTGSGGATPTYTSAWVLTDFWDAVRGAVFADQSGTLFIDQSADGINVDSTTSVAYTASATSANSYNVTLVLPYVRLRFTNGSVTAQTVFRLGVRWIAGETPV